MPVEILFKYRCMVFGLKYVRKQLSAFINNNELQISKCNQIARTVKVYEEFLEKSLMLNAIKLYNEVPNEQRQKLDKVKNPRAFPKTFYFKEYLKYPNALDCRDLSRDLCLCFIFLSFSVSNISLLCCKRCKIYIFILFSILGFVRCHVVNTFMTWNILEFNFFCFYS